MIADTSYLIAIDNSDADARAFSRANENAGVPQRVPTISILKLYISVGLGSQPNLNARSYEQLVENLPTVPLEENIARRAGVVLGAHRASDSKPNLGLGDAVVAATGLAYNEAVVTADVGDFSSVDGLEVVTWE